MFRTSQIINKTQLLKRFNDISRHLTHYPQAVLVTQKSGEHLVLVNAHIFEDFLYKRLEEDGMPPSDSRLDDVLASPKS